MSKKKKSRAHTEYTKKDSITRCVIIIAACLAAGTVRAYDFCAWARTPLSVDRWVVVCAFFRRRLLLLAVADDVFFSLHFGLKLIYHERQFNHSKNETEWKRYAVCCWPILILCCHLSDVYACMWTALFIAALSLSLSGRKLRIAIGSFHYKRKNYVFIGVISAKKAEYRSHQLDRKLTRKW